MCTWTIAGDAQGEAVFSWMEGGLFLQQRGAIVQGGVEHHALEIIGCAKPFGATSAADVVTSAPTPTPAIRSITYELEGDTLTIWGGAEGLPGLLQSHVRRSTTDSHRSTALARRRIHVHDDASCVTANPGIDGAHGGVEAVWPPLSA